MLPRYSGRATRISLGSALKKSFGGALTVVNLINLWTLVTRIILPMFCAACWCVEKSRWRKCRNGEVGSYWRSEWRIGGTLSIWCKSNGVWECVGDWVCWGDLSVQSWILGPRMKESIPCLCILDARVEESLCNRWAATVVLEWHYFFGVFDGGTQLETLRLRLNRPHYTWQCNDIMLHGLWEIMAINTAGAELCYFEIKVDDFLEIYLDGQWLDYDSRLLLRSWIMKCTKNW